MNVDQEQLFRAHDSAPQIIRDALRPSGIATTFIVAASNRYNLHVDVAGNLGLLVRNMLLGLLAPANFVHELEILGIPTDLARTLTSDLNKEVFMPLRDKVRSAHNVERVISMSKTPIPQVESANKAVIVNVSTLPELPSAEPAVLAPKSVLPPPSLAQIAPPKELKKIQITEEKPVEESKTPIYNLMRSGALRSAPAPVQPVPATPTPATASREPQPVVRTMAHDMEVLQHSGETPSPVPFIPSSPLPPASQMTPALTFQTASVPFSTASIAPQPPRPHPIDEIREIKVVEPVPQASKPVFQAQKIKSSPVPVLAGSDPYRESI